MKSYTLQYYIFGPRKLFSVIFDKFKIKNYNTMLKLLFIVQFENVYTPFEKKFKKLKYCLDGRHDFD